MELKITDSVGSRILLGEGLACFIKYFVRSLGKETETLQVRVLLRTQATQDLLSCSAVEGIWFFALERGG